MILWRGSLAIRRPSSEVRLVVSKPTRWQRVMWAAKSAANVFLVSAMFVLMYKLEVLHIFFACFGMALLVGIFGGRR